MKDNYTRAGAPRFFSNLTSSHPSVVRHNKYPTCILHPFTQTLILFYFTYSSRTVEFRRCGDTSVYICCDQFTMKHPSPGSSESRSLKQFLHYPVRYSACTYLFRSPHIPKRDAALLYFLSIATSRLRSAGSWDHLSYYFINFENRGPRSAKFQPVPAQSPSQT